MTFQEELLNSLHANSDRIAIETKTATWSFQDVASRAEKLTAFLLQQGLIPGTLVGIALADRAEMICAIIGVINARCVFVPLDGDMPVKRLDAVLNDTALQYLVTSGKSDEPWNAHNNLTCFDLAAILAGDTTTYTPPVYGEEDSIYVYFTSGSTGRPKGVVGKNKGLLHFIRWQIAEFGIDSSCRVSQFISPYFDAFLRDIFIPLFTGGVICIPAAGNDFFTPATISSWINGQRITIIHCVPSVFRIINDPSLTAADFYALQYVFLSGEKINPPELDNWYATFDERISLVNFYGPTETTMIKTFYRIQKSDAAKTKISIGKPMTGTELAVLNKNLSPCPRFVAGDLFILTDYCTNGYLNDPALTGEKFGLLTRSDGSKVMAFRTGDKGRWLDDGTMELMGRDDRQLKINGIRVDLNEIETVLLQSGLTKNVIVLQRTPFLTKAHSSIQVAIKEEKILAAFVLANENIPGQLLQEQLTAWARQYLPSYMIPSGIIILPAFPLLSNGKINYTELQNYKPPRTRVEPVGETERRLAGIWQEILGTDELSADESFHQAGGSSLSVMWLSAAIAREFTVRVELADLFNHPTIQQQAILVQNAKPDTIFDIPVAPVKKRYNVSAAQERIYYQYQLNKKSTAYNMPAVWEIKRGIDIAKAEEAFKKLIQRHESLRTVFGTSDNSLYQQVLPDIEFSVTEIVMSDKPASEAIISQIQPFNLETGPLIRCSVITAAAEVKILLVDIHHIISDGFSQIHMLSDFLNLYEGGTLPPLPLQYKDYAAWEAGFRQSAYYNECREFWLAMFRSGIPSLHLPVTDTGSLRPEAGANLFFSIEKETVHDLLARLKTEGVTSFSVFFTLYSLYLAQLTGNYDTVIGINTSGRLQPGLDGVVGMFAKTLPVRFALAPGKSIKDNSKIAHALLVGAGSRQLYDLADLVTELNRHRQQPVKSLFDTMFVFQDFQQKAGSSAELGLSGFLFEKESVKYPLSLFMTEREDVFDCKLEYMDRYFSKGDCEMIAMQFRELVELAAKKPDTTVARFFQTAAADEAQTAREIVFKF